jgi:hypothetical protein
MDIADSPADPVGFLVECDETAALPSKYSRFITWPASPHGAMACLGDGSDRWRAKFGTWALPSARASPEASVETSEFADFCPRENCLPDTFRFAAQPPAARVSAITRRFEALRESRRPLSRQAMTQSA